MIQDQRATRYLQSTKMIRRERRFSVLNHLVIARECRSWDTTSWVVLTVARVTINLWANGYIALFAALHRTIHYKGRLARTCAIYYCFGYMMCSVISY